MYLSLAVALLLFVCVGFVVGLVVGAMLAMRGIHELEKREGEASAQTGSTSALWCGACRMPPESHWHECHCDVGPHLPCEIEHQ